MSQNALSQTAKSQMGVSQIAASRTIVPRHAAGRPTPDWLLTVWAALAALAVCVAAVFYTPIEPPAAWRTTESVVVSLGRHAVPDDGLSL